MQKWEYCFVRFDYFAGNLQPQSINGNELRDKDKRPSLNELSNQLGEEGWEMVGINYTHNYGFGLMIFKRPKLD